MIQMPGMVMVGGNSRNSGKTTLACSIIEKLSKTHEVIGLKVTSIRRGEVDKHGNHTEEITSDFEIFEELDRFSPKDTSKMLRAGAKHVYYIRVTDSFSEKAILHFISSYINKELIVCESRSLRNILEPGLFLMMLRETAIESGKEISDYLKKANCLFDFGSQQNEIQQFIEKLQFFNGQFKMIKTTNKL
jgi:hypothetical protein